MLDALGDDLNISIALSVIDEMISSSNEKLDQEPKNKSLKFEINANIEFLDSLLGIGYKNPYEYFQLGLSQEQKDKIQNLINQRDLAKKDKDYKKADGIRQELADMKIQLMDTANGTVWEKIDEQ